MAPKPISRRAVAAVPFAVVAAGLVGTRSPVHASPPMHTRALPALVEPIPVVGLGTWQTFDIDSTDAAAMAERRQVLDVLFEAGGRVIDSSPMYGRAEAAVGALLAQMRARDKAFLATKVWTSGEAAGIAQMRASAEKMQTKTIDLMQIHNLVDWRTHLKTLRAWKDNGTFRAIGVTHYTTGAFDELMAIMRAEKIDFVQLPYSLAVPQAEAKLLALAAERGIGVIPNRPFDGANMFDKVRGKPLPGWAGEFDAKSFGQIFLKYLIGEPAVACVIPGTAKVSHMRDNVAAGIGRLPDAGQRRMIRAWWAAL